MPKQLQHKVIARY